MHNPASCEMIWIWQRRIVGRECEWHSAFCDRSVAISTWRTEDIPGDPRHLGCEVMLMVLQLRAADYVAAMLMHKCQR
jgi:hypothetical protein